MEQNQNIPKEENKAKVAVIGGGLAGVEAAHRLAKEGFKVDLYEMRPKKMTPAHKTGKLAELVCSNSLGGKDITTGSGLLKEEMKMMGSLVLEAAQKAEVPAGGALAVDREIFSDYITRRLEENPNINLIREEVKEIPLEDYDVVIVASGPLTSENLSEDIKKKLGAEYLHFYDAIAPIVDAETVDFSKGWWGSRYNKGGADYFNCPLTKEEYEKFVEELLKAQKVEPKDFEKACYFEGCMPIEVMAERGKDTLRYGPMKPVGLIDPRTGKEPYAVVQLRKENKEGTLLSLVGFQTKLTYPEQKRVFRLIPCLRNAKFVRLGSVHRNTFLQSNKLLKPTLQARKFPKLLFAGQITGVEGYVASAATGIVAGINAARLLRGQEPLTFPKETMIGALLNYITTKEGELQPMNPVFGLLPPLPKKVRNKKERKLKMAQRALKTLKEFLEEHNLASI
ncbi:MAG: FADH(2)-oxidizing methylenetetrahydrofolate--tRNA-(uracil(54)-C(5))-methyltransferase TrmFO [Aquificota bacterium]